MTEHSVELTNKTCLIVGASGTIGAAVAKQFRQNGARLALTYGRRLPEANVAELAPEKGQVNWYRVNVSDWKQVENTVLQANSDFGRIDVLVNCAGIIGPIGPTEDLSPQEWARTIEINLMGPMFLARAVIPLMKERGKGKIVFFSGGGAAYGRPYFTAYGSSKAALVRFTESLAQELETANIQVNAVAPGPVESRMWIEMRSAGESGGAQLLKELKRMEETGGVTPDRAAALTVFLASDRSGSLSGRLISALWDDWEHMDGRLEQLAASDALTLRRVPLN